MSNAEQSVATIELETIDLKPEDDEEHEAWGVNADFCLLFDEIDQSLAFPVIRECELIPSSVRHLDKDNGIARVLTHTSIVNFSICPLNRDTEHLLFKVTFVFSDGKRLTMDCGHGKSRIVDAHVERPLAVRSDDASLAEIGRIARAVEPLLGVANSLAEAVASSPEHTCRLTDFVDAGFPQEHVGTFNAYGASAFSHETIQDMKHHVHADEFYYVLQGRLKILHKPAGKAPLVPEEASRLVGGVTPLARIPCGTCLFATPESDSGFLAVAFKTEPSSIKDGGKRLGDKCHFYENDECPIRETCLHLQKLRAQFLEAKITQQVAIERSRKIAASLAGRGDPEKFAHRGKPRLERKCLLITFDSGLESEPHTISDLDESTVFRELKERVYNMFNIPEGEGYKYVIFWGNTSLPGYVDDDKPLGYVREEFGIPWGGMLDLKKVV